MYWVSFWHKSEAYIIMTTHTIIVKIYLLTPLLTPFRRIRVNVHKYQMSTSKAKV